MHRCAETDHGEVGCSSLANAAASASAIGKGRLVTILDLNNFATFPTLAVGLLVASLRNAGFSVRVVSPLAHGVPAVERERRERYLDHLARRVHLSTMRGFRPFRDAARSVRHRIRNRPDARVLRIADEAMDDGADIFLLSSYLQHYETVVQLGDLARSRGVPLLLGGPVFNMRATASAWRDVPGLTAIFGGEADAIAGALVAAACDGDDLLRFPGVTLPDGRQSSPAPPLRDLGLLPVPDFTDFPWDRYRVRVVPVMTGRGCQWSRCVFCSDVSSASGRTFRTRSVDAVLDELDEQRRRHDTSSFLFLDLKLNSSPSMLRGLCEGIPRRIPGAQWIGTVHVDSRDDNGLSAAELRDAAKAGMRRISFGLETGSQRLLDAMKKGSSVERCSEFIHDAHAAGLSVRCTMFKGFPGEQASDLERTAAFLERHAEKIDRVRFNEFSVLEDTPIYDDLSSSPGKYPQLKILRWDHRNANAQYLCPESAAPDYRRAKARTLRAVHAINRRPVRSEARQFDGLM